MFDIHQKKKKKKGFWIDRGFFFFFSTSEADNENFPIPLFCYLFLVNNIAKQSFFQKLASSHIFKAIQGEHRPNPLWTLLQISSSLLQTLKEHTSSLPLLEETFATIMFSSKKE